MNPIQAVRSVLQNSVNFSGRAMRSEYWWWYLFVILASTAISYADSATGLNGVLTVLFLFGALAPSLAVTIRRLHDRGHTAWFLLWQFVPLPGVVILLYQTVMPGDDRDNEYGPPPTAP